MLHVKRQKFKISSKFSTCICAYSFYIHISMLIMKNNERTQSNATQNQQKTFTIEGKSSKTILYSSQSISNNGLGIYY